MSKINSQNSIKDLVSKYDIDKNGKLDDSEKDIMRRSIFSVADENQDGIISNEEGQKYINRTGLKASVSVFINFVKAYFNTKVTEKEDGTKLIESINSDGKVSHAVKKDSDGNIICNIDYEYDSEGKIVCKTYRYNDGGIIAEEYDANGNLVYEISTSKDSSFESKYNSNGDKTYFVFKDSNGNIIDEYFMDYEYDSNGKKIKMITKSKDDIEEFIYNSNEQEIYSIRKNLDGKIIYETEYKYNGNNTITTTKYPNGDIEQEERDTNYNLIKTITTISGVSTEYEYDTDDKMTKKTIKNADGIIVSNYDNYTYDLKGNCTSYQGFSQIYNNNYKGDKYIINKSGNKITITNESTNETRSIHLKNILSYFPQEEISGMMKTLDNLPAEVLFELSAEIDYLKYASDEELKNAWKSNGGTTETGNAGGYYSYKTDLINVQYNDKSGEILTHELGHAIDNMQGNWELSSDKKFVEYYKLGMKRYLADGHKQYSYKSEKNESGTYCTTDIQELWAEIYALLMLGACNSKETLEKYFPEAIEYASKTLLNKAKTTNQSIRHRSSKPQ